jgi:hypothetical protein
LCNSNNVSKGPASSQLIPSVTLFDVALFTSLSPKYLAKQGIYSMILIVEYLGERAGVRGHRWNECPPRPPPDAFTNVARKWAIFGVRSWGRGNGGVVRISTDHITTGPRQRAVIWGPYKKEET